VYPPQEWPGDLAIRFDRFPPQEAVDLHEASHPGIAVRFIGEDG
jgi:hypothetical protein